MVGVVDTAQPTAPETAAVGQEKRKLRKSLFRFDLVLFTVCAILAIDTLGNVSSYGAQAVFWVVFSAATFMVPYGLIVAELGTAFPVEGATYEWVRLAYGRLAGAVTLVVYWASTPLWVGGTIAATAIAAIDTLWGAHLAKTTGLEVLVAGVFIWLAVLGNILSLRQMKWVANFGAVAKVVLLALFTLLVVVTGVRHGFAGSVTDGLFPTNAAVFLGVIGVLLFNWEGFEAQTNASEEMENPQRDVPIAILRSGGVVTLAYLIPIAAIILTVPGKNLTNLTGFVAGYQTVVTDAFGIEAATAVNVVVGAVLVFALLATSTTWLMSSDRMLAIASLAGSGPRPLGHFSERFGTPITANIVSGLLATVAMAGAFVVTRGNLGTFFAVVLSVTVSMAVLAYLPIFPTLIALRRKYPEQARPYRIPGGAVVAWICVALTVVYMAVGGLSMLWPSICTTSECFGAPALAPVSGLSRLSFELVAFGALAILVLIGVGFWLAGRPTAAEVDRAEETQPAAAGAGPLAT